MSISQYHHTGAEVITQALPRVLHKNVTYDIQHSMYGRGLTLRMIYRGETREFVCEFVIGEVVVIDVGRQMEGAIEKLYGPRDHTPNAKAVITITPEDAGAIPAVEKNAENFVVDHIRRNRDALIFLNDTAMRAAVEKMIP